MGTHRDGVVLGMKNLPRTDEILLRTERMSIGLTSIGRISIGVIGATAASCLLLATLAAPAARAQNTPSSSRVPGKPCPKSLSQSAGGFRASFER